MPVKKSALTVKRWQGSCVAGLVSSPVTIKNIEYAIIDTHSQQAQSRGQRLPVKELTGKRRLRQGPTSAVGVRLITVC